MKPLFSSFLACFFLLQSLFAQNSLVGDGFGGRSWYKPYNYTVGSYSAYTLCGANRQLYAWGSNNYGQLGQANIGYTVTPIKVPLMDSVAYYSTGYLMGAIKRDGSGWVWGKTFATPTRVIEDVAFVDAAIESCAFVKDDGTVWSIGKNSYGSFGNGQTSGQVAAIPVKMQQIQDAVRTAVGLSVTAVLLKNGEVMVCGGNYTSGLGNGTASGGTLLPVKVQGLKEIVDIKATTYGFCALDQQGEVWCWGDQFSPTGYPVKIQGLSQIVAISGCADGGHFLALDEQRQVWAWGDNSSGQCGTSIPVMGSAIDIPEMVATEVVDIMAGEWFSYLVKSDGSLWCAGFNGFIWLDLPRERRNHFVRLNPQAEGIGLCDPLAADETDNWMEPIDSSLLPVPHVLYFPNAFTPNGDPVNAAFRPIVKPGTVLQEFKLMLYNRWGQRVYSGYDLWAAWNGLHNGVPAPSGTYFYYCEYRQVGKVKQYLKGDVLLIR